MIDIIVGWVDPNGISLNNNRHRDNNELKYCLRSIYKYANWVRKIHIIIANNGNPPDWLNKHDKINIIKETELYYNVQPNSETKKLFYGFIDDLAEYFLTFDDDFFLYSKLTYNNLFYKLKPILNSAGKFDINRYDDGDGHLPLFWSKKGYVFAISKLKNKNLYLNMGNKRYNPFPEMKRILIKYKMVKNGNIYSPDIWINDRTPNNIFSLPYLIKRRHNIKYICINDDYSKEKKLYTKQLLYFNFIMSQIYNIKPPWEKYFKI